MNQVLVVLETTASGLHRMSLEALAAGQQLASMLNVPCEAAILGSAPSTTDLTTKQLATIHAIQHDLLAVYTADAWIASLHQLITQTKPSHIVFAHTYQCRDFAPALATRIGQTLIGDVTSIHEGPVFTRQWMQGKLNADYKHLGQQDSKQPCFVSVQAGSFRADTIVEGTATVSPFTPELTASRTRPSEPFREAAQTIDLGSAPIIVSVGRGIGEQENLTLVEDLAAALKAELAASRPICDAGWLPMERQVGSSGQTVAPKLYFAVGISGAIQHLVGMKGAKTVIAINRDPDAPIFEVADIGIAGDLFELVPAITKAIRASA